MAKKKQAKHYLKQEAKKLTDKIKKQAYIDMYEEADRYMNALLESALTVARYFGEVYYDSYSPKQYDRFENFTKNLIVETSSLYRKEVQVQGTGMKWLQRFSIIVDGKNFDYSKRVRKTLDEAIQQWEKRGSKGKKPGPEQVWYPDKDMIFDWFITGQRYTRLDYMEQHPDSFGEGVVRYKTEPDDFYDELESDFIAKKTLAMMLNQLNKGVNAQFQNHMDEWVANYINELNDVVGGLSQDGE